MSSKESNLTMNRPSHSILNPLVATLALALFGTAGTLGSAALGTAPAAFAQTAPQGAPGTQGGHGKRMGQILLGLGLNDKQKDQIRGIMAAARKQNEGVTDRDVRRANFKKATEQIDTVLTPAQRKQFHDKMAAMRQQYQAGQTSH
jgi:Spy/CpxP family protein refolding chaperone